MPITLLPGCQTYGFLQVALSKARAPSTPLSQALFQSARFRYSTKTFQRAQSSRWDASVPAAATCSESSRAPRFRRPSDYATPKCGLNRAARTGRAKSFFLDVVVPSLAFIICLVIWLGLGREAKIVGGLWFVVGLSYLAVRTRGFRLAPLMIDFKES